MATTSSTTQVIVFTISLLLVAFQAVHADYYRQRPPVTPTPYVPKPRVPLPSPSPKPVYRPPTTPTLPAGSIARLFLDPHNALRSRLGIYLLEILLRSTKFVVKVLVFFIAILIMVDFTRKTKNKSLFSQLLRVSPVKGKKLLLRMIFINSK